MARTPKTPKRTSRASTKVDETPKETSSEEEVTVDQIASSEAAPSADVSTNMIGPSVEDAPTADTADPSNAPATEVGGDVPGVPPSVDRSEHIAAMQSAPATVPPPAKQSPLLSILGGFAAGFAGFVVAALTLPGYLAGPPTSPSSDPTLLAQLEEQVSRVDTLTGDLEELRASAQSGETVDLGEVNARLDSAEGALSEAVITLESRIAAFEEQTSGGVAATHTLGETLTQLDARVTALDGRLTAIEEAEPQAPDGSEAMAAQLDEFRKELDAVTQEARRQIEEAQSRADEIEAAAAEAGAEAEREAALADIRAALDSGAAYTDVLSSFESVPEALEVNAASGVPTLASLQSDFPNAARSALSEAQTVPSEAGAGEKLAAFLARQTNARSLSPREGESANAVLSRAEAMLNEGDLDAALSELAALPEASAAAMSGWIEAAESRAAALNGFAELSGQMN